MKSTELIKPAAMAAPLAYEGTKNQIPSDATGTNAASVAEGFPELTSIPKADGGLPPQRADFNGMFYLSTDQRTYLQNGGLITFDQEVSDLIGGYPKGAVLDFISSKGDYQKVISLVEDNTNNFVEDESLIDEINWRKISLNGNGLPIGSVYPLICTGDYVPYGSLACDGSEYSKSQFLQLWENYLTGETPLLKTCTYEDYTSMVTTYGSCPMFGIDEESLKFKVPFIKDGTFIQQAQTDEELGKAYNAGLPNIKGTVANASIGGNGRLPSFEGAFSVSGTDVMLYGGNAERYVNNTVLNLDASVSNPIYGSSETVQPKSVCLRYFVVVSTGTINEAQMDWSEWASSIQSKADTDLSNLSEAGQAILDAKADADELDGVWVKKHKELLISVSCNGTSDLNLDLSDYLPSDDNAYELMLSGWAHLDGTAFHQVNCQVRSTLGDLIVASFISAINQGGTVGGSAILPVAKDRIFRFRRLSNTFGAVNLNVDAYRKVRS